LLLMWFSNLWMTGSDLSFPSFFSFIVPFRTGSSTETCTSRTCEFLRDLVEGTYGGKIDFFAENPCVPPVFGAYHVENVK
jgi:hypothetical protein